MKELFIALWLAQGADVATTVYGLNHGCREINPLLAGRSTSTLIAVKTGTTMAISVIAWKHRSHHPKTTKMILWTGIIAGVGAATWNMTQIPHC